MASPAESDPILAVSVEEHAQNLQASLDGVARMSDYARYLALTRNDIVGPELAKERAMALDALAGSMLVAKCALIQASGNDTLLAAGVIDLRRYEANRSYKDRLAAAMQPVKADVHKETANTQPAPHAPAA